MRRRGFSWPFALALAFFATCAIPPAPALAQRGQLVVCSSREFRENYCPADTRGGVQLVRQMSSTPCHEGRTWGYDRRGIWVSGGCEAQFATGYQNRGYGDRPGAYGDEDQRRNYGAEPRGGLVVCESRDYRYTRCETGRARRVELVRQLSKSECRYGQSWGYDREGVWVDRGCAAEFSTR
jgi:hypothetical protein